MSETKYLFERVKRAAKRAIDAERNGDLKVAFDQFLKAAELLNQLIAIERTKRIRDSYYVKAKEYIVRAKELKLLMNGPSDAEPPKPLPSPPKTQKPERKDIPPSPPAPKEEKKPPLPPPPKDDLPPPSEDITKKMMRGEDTTPPPPAKDEAKQDEKPTPPPPPKKPEPKEIDLPTKTTFELLFDEEKYRDCITESAKSVEAELRVRLGLFDEQLTLGMLINKGVSKGMEVLKEFKFVNIVINRIEHENYRPSRADAHKAVDITNRILMS